MLKIGKRGVDINNPPEGIWFDYQKGVRCKIRKMTGEVLTAMRKPLVKTSLEVDQRARKMVPVETVDPEAYEDACTDYILEDFEGFGDDDSKVLPLNFESKKDIMNYVDIKAWIWSCAQTVEVINKEAEDEEIKN